MDPGTVALSEVSPLFFYLSLKLSLLISRVWGRGCCMWRRMWSPATQICEAKLIRQGRALVTWWTRPHFEFAFVACHSPLSCHLITVDCLIKGIKRCMIRCVKLLLNHIFPHLDQGKDRTISLEYPKFTNLSQAPIKFTRPLFLDSVKEKMWETFGGVKTHTSSRTTVQYREKELQY